MRGTLHFLISTILFISCATLPNGFRIQNNRQQKSRLSLADSAEWTEYHNQEPEGPGTYSFGYDIEDSQTGNIQFRTEERRRNGTVSGSYGFVSPEGDVHIVHYVADHLGYRTKIEEIKRLKYPNENYKSLSNYFANMSPQMISALQSLGNSNRFQKEDQHIRPIDKLNLNSQNGMPSLSRRGDEYHQKKNHVYNVYFVPPNMN